MTDESIRQLVARLRSITIDDSGWRTAPLCVEAADAIERLSVKAEPVAWVAKDFRAGLRDYGRVTVYERAMQLADQQVAPVPLYLHPAAPAPEGPDHPDGPDSEGFHGVRPYAPNLIALVNRQAEDEGLWFVAQTAPEAYLQAALRKLHAAIEGEQEE